jgi:hypothetical protein
MRCILGGSFSIKNHQSYSSRLFDLKTMVAKQLHVEVVVETPVEGVESYSKGVLDAMNLAPVVGLSWRGEDKNLLDLFSVIDKREPIVGVFAPKVKRMRELKNLDCSISPMKCQRWRGFFRSKNVFSFPPNVR